VVHGRTDELGFHAVEQRHYITDIHATVLHLLGLDQRRLEVPGHKRLDIERIAAIKKIAAIPLTLHGGSGTDNDDFRKAIQAGITMIHINTELRVAWRKGLEAALGKDTTSVAPYKILPEVVDDVKAVVVGRLKLFNGK